MNDELIKRLRMYKCGSRDSVTGQIDSEAAADLIEQQAAALEAANARIAELEAALTVPDYAMPPDGQDWAKVSPEVAFHLIDRHAENWAHAGQLMEAWRDATTASAQSSQQGAVAEVRYSNDLAYAQWLIEAPATGTKLYTHPHATERDRRDADALSLQAKYEDACIHANKNARDAERWRFVAKHAVILDASVEGMISITIAKDADSGACEIAAERAVDELSQKAGEQQ